MELKLPQLGWSGDRSPGTPKDLEGGVCKTRHGFFDESADGSIRAFVTGAIAQHYTLSLDRIPGEDFRRATDEELNALEAFQRWLGRRFYNLRDCERLIDEAMNRLDLGVSADNPIDHCMFNLSAVSRVLHESKLASLHMNVQKEAKHARSKLTALQAEAKNAVGGQKPDQKRLARIVKALGDIHASIRAMRDSIATQVAAL